MRRRWTVGLFLALLAGTGAAQEEGKTYFWLRMWPDLVARYDIESDQVVDRIQLRHGVCHGFQASHDESQLFLVTGQRTYVEVVDVARAEWLEEHSFEEPERIVRVDELRERPGGERWYVKIDRVKKEPDHYVVEEPEWLDYDRTAWEVGERMKELPEPIRRGARISPGGDEWHVFGKDITIVDPATLEEKGRILLSRPLYGGMGPLSIRGDDLLDGENPDAYRLLYTMRDPVKKNRSLMGIVDIDIPGRRVAGVHEWGAAPRVWQFLYTKDKKTAVAQLGTGERQNQYDGQDPVDAGFKKQIPLQHEYMKTVELEGETEGQILTLGG